ncbi:hypothetical protein Ahy_A02g006180 [Arachis hypogaea]|uniref:Uncharacterized protein n=1 Tax=Arachis hypogaea TaxID=3818 RepID=A0A445E9G4_ARAHY|nr:hypothetical protein Ahy_A02g006180 [Arachis hypogaea]
MTIIAIRNGKCFVNTVWSSIRCKEIWHDGSVPSKIMDCFVPNFTDSSFGVHLHHPNLKPLIPRGNHSTSGRNHFTLANSYNNVCLYCIFHYPSHSLCLCDFGQILFLYSLNINRWKMMISLGFIVTASTVLSGHVMVHVSLDVPDYQQTLASSTAAILLTAVVPPFFAIFLAWSSMLCRPLPGPILRVTSFFSCSSFVVRCISMSSSCLSLAVLFPLLHCSVAKHILKVRMVGGYFVLRNLKLHVTGYVIDIVLVEFSLVRKFFFFVPATALGS